MATLVGKKYRTESGKEFRVLAERFYPRGTHDRANGKYLDSLRAGYLVSAAYQGHPVPLITLDDGVVRLVEVEVAGKRLRRATDISSHLGVSETRKPVVLQKM
jgi:hypothetical protein